MELVQVSTSSHWYDREAKPCFDSGLREARKVWGTDAEQYGSITSILREKAKPALMSWMKEQAILSALTLPRKDGESYQDFAKRVVKDSEEESSKAAQFGTLVHAMFEDILKGRNLDLVGDREQKIGEALRFWCAKYVEKVILTETPLVDTTLKYGGTMDAFVQDENHKYLLIDMKTQNTKKGKVSKYPEWCYQLAAQDNLLRLTGAKVDRWINLVVSTSDAGMVEVVEWDADDIKRGFRVFRALTTVFYLDRKLPYMEEA